MLVRRKDRIWAVVIVASVLGLCSAPAPASGCDDCSLALAALQAKANQAEPRDRCFLYAELVSQMTELAGHQFSSGDSRHAGETLMMVQLYAENIHKGIADDSRRLKNAEWLVRRTSVRIEDLLREASYEDRPALETTLKQLNEVQLQILTQVFKK